MQVKQAIAKVEDCLGKKEAALLLRALARMEDCDEQTMRNRPFHVLYDRARKKPPQDRNAAMTRHIWGAVNQLYRRRKNYDA